MASPDSSPRVIVVTGDVTMDWNLASIEQSRADPPGSKGASPAWDTDEATRAYLQVGGVALLGELISAVAKPLEWTVHGVGEIVREMDNRFRQSYAVWSPFPAVKNPRDEARRVWRVEKFLGLDRRSERIEEGDEGLEAVAAWNRSIEDVAASLVVLDDAGLSFRRDERLWPTVLLDPNVDQRPWYLVKMARPVARDHLFECLVDSCADRMIVVTRINDLRQSEVRVSREHSWERTAQDLFWELTYNPSVKALARSAHVVISIETGGALLMSRKATEGEHTPQATLFYDPQAIESQWAQQHPGAMIGSTSCLAAGVARQVMLDPDNPILEAGIQGGIAAMRALQEEGWGEGPAEDPVFPTWKIAGVLAEERTPLEEIGVPPPPTSSLLRSDFVDQGPGPGSWTILDDRCRDRSVVTVARTVAEKGVGAALSGVPVGQFGRLETVDRHEIEGLGSIRALIHEYKRQSETRPLSIAVFGPPGSGKSFAVKQVAQSLLGDEVKELTFNLSQLNDPSELHGALHQVRDACLKGLLPLVFWDEFDSTLGANKLGWLRHFLVPMQDGTFQQGEITHPIGRAIFVFAGGIYESMEQFRSPTEEQVDEFKRAKARDFLSRLRGFVDIAGTDARGGDPDQDPYFRVRRAILLRSILRGNRPNVFRKEGTDESVMQIDGGVLRGFLETRTYRHGVRSLESIVAMSTLAGKSHFERSSLPEDAQLDLHVDAEDFLAWVQGPDVLVEIDLPAREEERDELERFAEAVHVVYCEKVLEDGFTWFAPTDEYLEQYGLLRPFVAVMPDRRAAADSKTKPSLVAYKDLREDLKQQNRDFARDIPHKLAIVGYIMRPARAEDRLIPFSAEEVEVLAEQEHERWMRQKLELEEEWRWGPDDDEAKRESKSLVPWRALAKEEKLERYGAFAGRVGDEELEQGMKDWDRFLVRGIPQILAVAGYTIARHARGDTHPEHSTEKAP